MPSALPIPGLAPVLEDLGLKAAEARGPADAAGATIVACAVEARAEPAAEARALAHCATRATDHLLVFLPGEHDEATLARWRDALWPAHHLTALYRLAHTGIVRRTLQGETPLKRSTGLSGHLLALRPRAAVFARDAVAAKFDTNAASWNGVPGKPGYAHFRWMRRFVGTFAPVASVRRILDFGCGAGWVGIEAALGAPGAELCAFDPSPEMVALAEENARANGVARFTGRVGFGEDPPFPAAGEAPFELVLSSGVVSFSGDLERFTDGLVRTVAPGGTLVVGDLNPHSRGMAKRRRTRALLPLRELNAPSREEVARALAARGWRCDDWAGYQLTSPVPELMHWSARRLGGVLDAPLLAWNRRSTGQRDPERFDSWVMRCTRG
jgi:SAM-dependent methyltransferase